jgi:hypothetical protein
MQWSKEKQTDKGRQYNGQKKNKQIYRSKIQWSKEKQADIYVDNTMV